MGPRYSRRADFPSFIDTSWFGLTAVSLVRCVAICTDRELRCTKTFISLTWVVPFMVISALMFTNWGSKEHTGKIHWRQVLVAVSYV